MELAEVESLFQRAEQCVKHPYPKAESYASNHCAIEMLQAYLKQPKTSMARALTQSKLGIYLMQSNDSHHAQEAFEGAVKFLFPQLEQFATTTCSLSGACEDSQKVNFDVGSFRSSVQALVYTDTHNENVLCGPFRDLIIDMLTQLGMIFYNRSDSLRALCYFCACEKLCSDSLTPVYTMQTHIQFYLAQVYACLQCHAESAKYCVLTLAYQLRSHLSRSNTVVFDHEDWISNALQLVQFFLKRGKQTYQASVMLLASEQILYQDKITMCDIQSKSPLSAEVQLSWASLQLRVLEQAHDENVTEHNDYVPVDEITEVLELISEQKSHQPSVGLQCEDSEKVIMQSKWLKMRYVNPETIHLYDDAVQVFCLGMKACEDAKNHFQMDGYVSTHIRICQIQSKLFDRLSKFECDPKRQYSLQLRRYHTLRPILEADININAFGDLVQQVAYEGGEILADLYDRKLLLEASRTISGSSSGRGIMYASRAILCYEQYVRCFYASDPKVVPRGNHATLPKDPKLLSANDMHALLLGYFALAQLCSRITFKDDAIKTREFWKLGLAYFETIVLFRKKFDETNELEGRKLQERFKTEFSLTEEMLQLLPEKINVLVYRGNQL